MTDLRRIEETIGQCEASAFPTIRGLGADMRTLMREIVHLRDEVAWWQQWSNELTEIIPEGEEARWSNPEGAQEQIVLDCYRAYRRQLDAAMRIAHDLKAAAEREPLISDDEAELQLGLVARRLRAALEIEDG